MPEKRNGNKKWCWLHTRQKPNNRYFEEAVQIPLLSRFVLKNCPSISLHDPCIAQGTPNRPGVPVYHISRIPLLITITRISILTVLGKHSNGSRKSWATIFLLTICDMTFRMEYYCACKFFNCLCILVALFLMNLFLRLRQSAQ